jgi:cation transport regulator ChaC
VKEDATDLLWYFAYGSNMHSETIRGRRGIAYRSAVAARALGWRLVFDKPPLVPGAGAAANIVADPGATAPGVVFEITRAELEHVELTEGVLIDNYRRVEVLLEPLVRDPGARVPTTAFSLSSTRGEPGVRPSSRYMEIVIAGAREHGLPEEHVRFLERVPVEPESAEMAALRPLIDEAMRRRR